MINWNKSKYFPNTLAFRIFAFFWLSFAILLGLSFVLPLLFSDHSYIKIPEKDVSLYHNEIINNIRTKNLIKILQGETPRFIDENTDELKPVIVNKQGQIFGATKSEESSINQFIYNSSDPVNPLQKDFYNIRIVGPFWVSIDVEDKSPYFVYFISEINSEQKLVTLLFENPLIFFLCIMCVSSPILWWLSHSISKPLKKLQKASRMVALGDFKIDKSLENQGTIELRQVGHSFNHMTEALENLISHQKVLLSSISHELRTPLTRLQLSVALLRRNYGDIPILKRIEKESNLIDKMVNDLLLLSRQQINSHLVRSIFSVNQLLNDIFDDAKFEATQNQLKFKVIWDIPENNETMINGNQDLLESAIENVVRNALKYTKSYLEVSVTIKHSMLSVSIDDNGEGISSSEYENIFKPFYRVDEARTAATGGAGLGLAIVDSIITEHQGKVWAEKSHLGGLRVVIKLPIFDYSIN